VPSRAAETWALAPEGDSQFTDPVHYEIASNLMSRTCGYGEPEVNMQNWKKGLVFGTIGAGAVLIMTGRRPAGMAFAAAGLAVLASEYPEKFEAVWENAPDYLRKGMQIFSTLQKLGEGFAEEAERRSVDTWRSIRSEYGS